MKFEYVASGLSFLRVRFKESHSGATAARLNDIWALLRGKHNHEFSFLYNAFIEKEFGEFFKGVYRGKGVNQIYADSGGLQMITLGKTITPELKQDVYTNQGLYSDCAMSFDEIPVSLKSTRSARSDTSSKYFDREKFEWCARESGRNIRDQIETFNKMKSEARPFFIAQGNDLESYVRWTELALEEIPKELHDRIGGVALGAVALGTGTLEDCKRAFYYTQLPLSQTTHHFHLLGVGSVSRLLPVIAMKNHEVYQNTLISYDSTTHTSGVQMGRYYGPDFQWITPGRLFVDDEGTYQPENGIQGVEDYSFINADIRNYVKDYHVEDDFFMEAMNVPVRAYQKLHNGNFLPPIEAFSSYFVGSTMNFIRHVESVANDFTLAHDLVNKKTYSAINDMRNVKTKQDFEHWLRHAGTSLDSTAIEDGQPTSLPEDF
jgi:hypothetical protein